MSTKRAPTYVSNHVSWMDIFLFLSSPFMPGFAAKAEVARVPVVGEIARQVECIFIERGGSAEVRK